MRRIIAFTLFLITIFSITGCHKVPADNGTPPDMLPNDIINVENSITKPEEIINPELSTDVEKPIYVPTLSTDAEDPSVKNFTIKLSFAGDAMLATYKGQSGSGSFNRYADEKDPSYFFEKVYDIFANDDFTTVNLENVFTDRDLKEVEKDHNPAYWFRSKTKNVNVLLAGSVEGVSLANNHLGDYGSEGKKDTIATVENAGLQYGLNDRTFYYEKNGFKIAVICHGLWGEWQADSIISRIKKAEQNSDYQIVFYHGGTEKLHNPEQWKQRASKKLVDAGADLVIGNHPHVLQPREVYNGVEIIYSLGNFCYGGHTKPENRTIIYQMELRIDSETKKVMTETSTIIPCYVFTGSRNNYQPTPITNQEEIDIVMDFMEGNRELPY